MKTEPLISPLRVIVSVMALAALGACNMSSLPVLDPSAIGLFQDEDAKLTERNYAAADYLFPQLRNYAGRQDAIRADLFSDAEQPGISADIGRIIPEQIGIRFSQLGYTMDLSAVAAEGKNDAVGAITLGVDESPDFVLGGSYIRRANDILVSARVSRFSNGQIVASFDYAVPIDREVSKYSQPTPRITKRSN